MRFYVFHYETQGRLPQLTPEQGQSLKKGIALEIARRKGVKYHGTMLDPITGIGICDWEATNKGDIEAIFKALKVPYDQVVPVQPLKL